MTRAHERRSPSGLPLALLCVAMAGGCSTPVKQYRLTNLSMSCEEANRFTYDTLGNLGFTVSSFKPAKMGQPGEAKAKREAGEAGLPAEKVTVSIDCGPTGAAVDAREDGKLLGQLEFKRAFYISFTAAQSMAARRAEMARKVAEGEVTPPAKSEALRVLIEPVRGQAAMLVFELDFAAAGLLPVRIQIHNPSARRYTLTPEAIQLRRRDQARVAPLSTATAAAHIARATRDGGEPVTTMSAEAIAERLDGKWLRVTHIGPRSDVTGYLYFPLADYVRARAVLTEQDSDETEGFVVKF